MKNNLQLIVALIRLEARNERRGEKVNLQTLAGRIESLHLLYQALSSDVTGDEVDLGHYLSQIAAAVMNTCAVEGIRLDQKTDYAPVSVNTALSRVTARFSTGQRSISASPFSPASRSSFIRTRVRTPLSTRLSRCQMWSPAIWYRAMLIS